MNELRMLISHLRLKHYRQKQVEKFKVCVIYIANIDDEFKNDTFLRDVIKEVLYLLVNKLRNFSSVRANNPSWLDKLWLKIYIWYAARKINRLTEYKFTKTSLDARRRAVYNKLIRSGISASEKDINVIKKGYLLGRNTKYCSV